jgi:hypothetical protein
MHGYDLVQLFYKVHLESAAYATVLQGHQAVILHAYYASLLYKAGVNVNFTYIVYNNSEFNSFAVSKNPVYKGCLSAA